MENKSIHIVIIVPFFTLGGAETQAYNIAVGFKAEGHRVTVLAFQKKNGLLWDKLEKSGIDCKLIPFDLSLFHSKGFRKFFKIIPLIAFFRKLKPDYLFPFTYYPNVAVSLIWKFTGAKKCFWNQRGLENNDFLFFEKLAIKMKPFYLSNSKAGAIYIEKRHRLIKNQVRIISNGVEEVEPIDSEEVWKERLGLKGEVVFTMVANFYPEKNHEYLLKAWEAFSGKLADKKLRLVLVGYAPLPELLWKLKSVIYDLKLDNVTIIENTNDISGLLKVSDFGVLTSESEGCPNSVLEMMKLEVPVITSYILAHQEIFGDHYPLYCHLNDITSLVNVFKKTISDKQAMKKIKKENLELVNNKNSINQLKDSYVGLIR